jgi:sulfoxide reductase heme-binding subunit YedZ
MSAVAADLQAGGTARARNARRAAWAWQAAAIVLVCLPLAGIAWQLVTLPVKNPSQLLQRGLGLWALRLLLVTLAITPLVRRTGWYRLVPLRRTFGLAAFAYACAHLAVYLWLDMGFDTRELAVEIATRPFIVIGAAVFVCLVPLAATSTAAAQRALGGRRWKALHRLVYAAVLLAALHYVMVTKVALTLPLLHAAAAVALLLLRWPPRRTRDARAAQQPR